MKHKTMTMDDLKKLSDSFDAKKAASEVVGWVCGNIEMFIDNHRQEFSIAFSSKDAEGLDELGRIESAFESLGIADSGIPEEDIFKAASLSMSEDDAKRAEALIRKFNDGEPVSEDDLEDVKSLLDMVNEKTDPGISPLLDESRQREIDDEAEKLIILYDMIDRVKDILENDKELLDTLFEKLIFYYELCGFRDGHKVEKDLTGYVKIDHFEYFAYEIPVSVTPKIPKVDESGNVVVDKDGKVVIEEGETTVERIPPSFNLDISLDYWEKKPMTSMF